MSGPFVRIIRIQRPAFSSNIGTTGYRYLTFKQSQMQDSTPCAYRLDVRLPYPTTLPNTDNSPDWAFQKFNDPYIQGAAPYIDQAISWARQTGLKVWIDLHGAPGSQNGFDNSGHNGTVGWGTGSTVADTLSVIQQIANKYAQDQYQDVVAAIEVLNEPLATSIAGGLNTVLGYYDNAYGDVRSISDTEVMLHDAFQTGTTFNDVLTNSGGNVVIDHHEYQVFTEELINLSPDVSKLKH